jgi:hypothetical protein
MLCCCKTPGAADLHSGFMDILGSLGRHLPRHPDRNPGGVYDRSHLGRACRDAARDLSPRLRCKEPEM